MRWELRCGSLVVEGGDSGTFDIRSISRTEIVLPARWSRPGLLRSVATFPGFTTFLGTMLGSSRRSCWQYAENKTNQSIPSQRALLITVNQKFYGGTEE